MTGATRLAAFTLKRHGNGVADVDGRAFDAPMYSRMKHGDVSAIRVMGGHVASALLAVHRATLMGPEPVLLPVAYMHVRPACWFLSEVVAQTISSERMAQGLGPARLIKIHKDAVTATDYAHASAEQRAAEMGRIRFSLDEPVAGAHVVVVDDVRVTGLAEATTFAALAAGHAVSRTAVYVAVVNHDLSLDPAVEARLNHASVTTVTDMVDAARSDQMVLTIRFLKLLLGASKEERSAFLDACSPALLWEMMEGARGTGAQFLDAYRTGFTDLEGRLDDVSTRRPAEHREAHPHT